MDNTSSDEKRASRGATQLSLDWLAKRVRKAHSIKQRLDKGTYKVKVSEVAKSILSEEEQA